MRFVELESYSSSYTELSNKELNAFEAAVLQKEPC